MITLSQCDSGKNAGAPKQKTVVIPAKTKATDSKETKVAVGTSGANAEQIDKAKSLISSASNTALEGIKAKKVFKTNCAYCHGFTGNLGINGSKDLTASVVSLEEAVAQIYFGKGLMTPYKGILSDIEIVAVAKYAETLRK